MNEQSHQDKGLIILVLGILSFVGCCVCGPIAWWMGSNEVAAMDAGRVNSENRQMAQIGKILGIVSTVLYLLFVAFYIVMILVFGGVAMMAN